MPLLDGSIGQPDPSRRPHADGPLPSSAHGCRSGGRSPQRGVHRYRTGALLPATRITGKCEWDVKRRTVVQWYALNEGCAETRRPAMRRAPWHQVSAGDRFDPSGHRIGMVTGDRPWTCTRTIVSCAWVRSDRDFRSHHRKPWLRTDGKPETLTRDGRPLPHRIVFQYRSIPNEPDAITRVFINGIGRGSFKRFVFELKEPR